MTQRPGQNNPSLIIEDLTENELCEINNPPVTLHKGLTTIQNGQIVTITPPTIQYDHNVKITPTIQYDDNVKITPTIQKVDITNITYITMDLHGIMTKLADVSITGATDNDANNPEFTIEEVLEF